MPAGTELTQGFVELGREKQHEERHLEGHVAGDHAHPQRDGDEPYCRGGHELEHEPREEGIAQHLHGAPPELLARRRDLLALIGAPAEDLEGGEALHGIEETCPHAREGPPLAPGVLLRVPADEDHEHRDHRRRNQQQNGARKVPRKNVAGYYQGNEHAEKDLRQVAPNVSIELLYALRGRRRKLARPLPHRVRRPQPQDVREHPFPQLGLHPHGPPLAPRPPGPTTTQNAPRKRRATAQAGREPPSETRPARTPRPRPCSERPTARSSPRPRGARAPR